MDQVYKIVTALMSMPRELSSRFPQHDWIGMKARARFGKLSARDKEILVQMLDVLRDEIAKAPVHEEVR